MKVLMLIILLLFLICVVFLPANVQLKYYREGSFRKFELLVKFWFIPLYYKKTQKVNLPSSPGSLLRQQQRLRARLSSWQRTGGILRPITRTVKIKKISFYSELGLNGPAQTALAVGSTWWVLGTILSLINCKFNPSDPENKLMILPNYRRQNYLLLNLSCILELPLGHIMIILYYFFFDFRSIAKSAKEGCL